MVRRTKADALATRNSLLDAAEHLFQERGVSRTSLNDIATAAGTTRGAIYWHFKDKADLFNAMMERVTMPLEGTLACTARAADAAAAPLLSLRDSMMSALRQTATDEQTRRVFEVATHKVEYVSEMQAVRDRHLQVRNECMTMTEEILQQAVAREGVRLKVSIATAALGLHVIMDGLIQNWLLEPDAFDLVESGRDTMDVYLAGLGFNVPAGQHVQSVGTPDCKLAAA
ncbi:TetR family transcriptional regulator [Hydrogenophaga laconesensis]|uniref:TetR/AcrR family acrAB operon transcriptional repressor n=1 Tax=Hydrogenophaga laconesensis TaxID=1805971 RepID=A0ABU1V9G5_9BURK|nr:TetR family transcriptional regulator [Hydrogenophaga laconesensis]MDR7094104.1 TetR/AcrR family acrAB operon transcriptional repressor [Hydrogenophaga laconesensis]